MELLRLAWKNIRGSAFRSLAIFLCAALVAGLALSATVIVRGAEGSLRANLERLGADILVLPWGTMTEKIGGIRLMSAAIDGWMPAAYMDKIAALEGVAQVSPQLYLANLEDSPYSPYPDMYLVAYDPASDFTLRPWLKDGQGETLAVGEAIAGAHLSLAEGSQGATFFGMALKPVARLAATETSIDNTLFVSFETAERMLAWSQQQDSGGLDIMPNSVSAVMVRLELGSDPHEMSIRILDEVKGVVPLEAPNLFQAGRQQMVGILRTLLSVLGGIWALAVVFMGLVFTIAVNERRYEIGVLRALGFSGRRILNALLMEGAILAVLGGTTGLALTAVTLATLGETVAGLTRLPLHFPAPLELLSLSLGGQTLALASVTLAAILPVWRISHEDVAAIMRE